MIVPLAGHRPAFSAAARHDNRSDGRSAIFANCIDYADIADF
ncbi:hypothetical protein [Sphingopyxis sp. 550A]